MTVIKFEEEKHLTLVQSWAEAKELAVIPSLLSQSGFMSIDDKGEPIMVVWVYFILGIPIVQLDNLIAKPGLNIFTIRKAWNKLFSVINDFLDELEKLSGIKYIMIRNVMNDRLTREAKKSGFKVDERTFKLSNYFRY